MSANTFDAARAAELEGIVALAAERVRTNLDRLSTQCEYDLDAFSRKVPYAAGRRYHQLIHGETQGEYPVIRAGQVLLALRLLPRLVADGYVSIVDLEHGLVVRYTAVPPTPPKPNFADELLARDMTSEDVGTIARFGYGDPDAWRRFEVDCYTRAHGTTTVVATYRGRPVGFASYHIRGASDGGGRGESDGTHLAVDIRWIAVARKWRRKGVGKFLIRMIDQRVRGVCVGRPTERVTYQANVVRACLPMVPFFIATGFVVSLMPGNRDLALCVRDVPVERLGIAPSAS